MDEPGKISHSRYILSSLYFWSDSFADTDRVTAEDIGEELETFARILGFGFQHEGEIAKSVELWLKLFSMSHKLYKTGNWLDVIPLALEKIESVDIPIGLKIRLLNKMGQVYRLENQFQQAMKLSEKAMALYQSSEIEDDFLLADCHLHLADINQFANHPEMAVPYIEKVLGALTFKTFPTTFQATALVLAGLIFNKLQKYEIAVNYYQNALGLWKEKNDSIELARTYSNLGQSYIGLKLYDAALELFVKSLDLFEDYPYEKARSFSNMGILHYHRNEFVEALNFWEQADSLLTSSGSSVNLEAAVKHNIGVATRSLERYSQAEAYFTEAIKLRKKSQNNIELARSYGGLGETYLLWEKYRLAIDQYDLAIDIIEDYPAEKLFLGETIAEREEARQRLIEKASKK